MHESHDGKILRRSRVPKAYYYVHFVPQNEQGRPFDRRTRLIIKLIERANANFLQNAIYKILECMEITCSILKMLVILYNKNIKNSVLDICFTKAEILEK